MITEKFKERINYLKNNHLIVEALYEILDELNQSSGLSKLI